jgi:hypothetical protein
VARMIRYAPQRQALYHPELDLTVLTPGADPPLDALCAEMSRLCYRRFGQSAADRAYVESAVAHAGFGDTEFFTAGSNEAFATLNQGSRTAIVAFRGTQSDDVRDLITDLRFFPVDWLPHGGNVPQGKVHSGFAGAAMELLDKAGLRAWIARHSDWARVYTGHSLGAAIATLAAAAEPPRDLVTFGSPRVGDATFGRALENVAVRRYVDCCDIVTRVPSDSASYHHVGTLRYIDRFGIVGNLTDLNAIHDDQDHGRFEYFHDYATVPGDVLLRDLADHAPANYVYSLFSIAAPQPASSPPA